MGRKRGGERILGPYEHGTRWRITFVSADGKRDHRHFATEREAQGVADAARVELQRKHGTTVAEAIDRYEAHLTLKGNKPHSVATTVYRLEWFFGEHIHDAVNDVTPEQAAQLYRSFAEGKAADSHRNVLAEVRTFGRWWVADKLADASPFEGVQGIGKRRTGKPQLRRDEARRWLEAALARAQRGDAIALAAAMALTMGLRASEVIEREARDVDDDGALLVIDRSKTDAGERAVPVPDMLRALLKARAGEVDGGRLFPFVRHSLLRRVQTICAEAGVPRVCTHSLRGFLTTAAVRSGIDPNLVASYVGHTSAEVTLGNYVAPGTHEAEQRRRGLKVLVGGR